MPPYVNVVIVGGISGNMVGARLGARYTSTTSSADCGTAGTTGGITTRWHSVHLNGSDDTGLEKGCHRASSSGSQAGSGTNSQTGSHSGVPDGCSCRISVRLEPHTMGARLVTIVPLTHSGWQDSHLRIISRAYARASLRCSAVISMFANFSAYVRVGFNGVSLAMVQDATVG